MCSKYFGLPPGNNQISVNKYYNYYYYIHHQELATIPLNYHFGRIVLGSLCVGVSVWLGWSDIRVAG